MSKFDECDEDTNPEFVRAVRDCFLLWYRQQLEDEDGFDYEPEGYPFEAFLASVADKACIQVTMIADDRQNVLVNTWLRGAGLPEIPVEGGLSSEVCKICGCDPCDC